MRSVWIAGDPEVYHRYHRAVEAAGGKAVFSGDPAQCGALLLPGGGDPEPWRYDQRNLAARDMDPKKDEEELLLLDRFVAAKKPILGICRGLQMINLYFGGTLLQDIADHDRQRGRDRLHAVRTDPWLAKRLGAPRIVNSAHHQAADRLGRHLHALQWAPDGVIEALHHDALPILALQWHPERITAAAGAEAVYFSRRVIRETLIGDGL